MNLTKELKEEFEKHHKGGQKGSPVKIADLLKDFQERHPDLGITERELRKAYEPLPTCETADGLYFPKTIIEKERQIKLEEKRIRAYWRRRKVMKQYRVEEEWEQLNIFEGRV